MAKLTEGRSVLCPSVLVNLKPVHPGNHLYSSAGGAVTCTGPTEGLRKRRLVLPASKHCHLIFVTAPHGRASFAGAGLTPVQIQPPERSPEEVVKILGHDQFEFWSLRWCSGQVPHYWGHPNRLRLLQSIFSCHVCISQPRNTAARRGVPVVTALSVAAKQGGLGWCPFCS